MKNLEIKGTMDTPTVVFNYDGNFLIEGRSFPDNAIKTFEPLFNWIASFRGEKVKFTINLDYLNTSSSMQLFKVLKALDKSADIKEIKVLWQYEVDDDEHQETGKIFEEQLERISFQYMECIC